MLSITQIGTIPLRSIKWSETILEWILQNVNNMKIKKIWFSWENQIQNVLLGYYYKMFNAMLQVNTNCFQSRKELAIINLTF